MPLQNTVATYERAECRNCDDALSLLDEAHDLFATGSVDSAMSHIVEGLHLAKRLLPSGEWALFRANFMHHPVTRIIHQDPFTAWSYRKPRGYAGDAWLLDFIYQSANV